MDLSRDFMKEQLRDYGVEFNPGDTVRVYLKIQEGDKERIQVFQGIVLQKRGSGISQTFTVRKISNGIGVEKIFPFHSPAIDKIEVTRYGDAHRAKLYYLRSRVGKKAKVKEKDRQKVQRMLEKQQNDA